MRSSRYQILRYVHALEVTSEGLKMIGVVKTSNFTFTYPFPILSTTSAQIFASQPSCLCSPFSTLRALLAVESQGKTLQSGHINFYLIK
jgi:hypothetical protein